MADDRLAALVDVNVLDGHLLLPLAPVALESLELGGVGAQQLHRQIAGVLEIVPVLRLHGPAQKLHRRAVRRDHLRGEHRFGLVAWRDAGDRGQGRVDGGGLEVADQIAGSG